MFKNNKYTKIYNNIITNAVSRQWKKQRGRERHHIIPQSLGGSNDKDNLVYLSCREHAICHWLLVKMTVGEAYSKMVYAFNGMNATNELQDRYYSPIISRAYERNRVEQARIHSETMKNKNLTPWNKGGVPITDKHRENLRKAALNRPKLSAESQQKRIAKVIGQKRTDETRAKMSQAHKGKLKGPMSEEEKLKRSLKQKGVAKKPGHSDNVRNAVLGNVSINKDGIEKKVKRDTLDQWLSEGWCIGGRKRK
jgi:hypothetical protein